MSIDVMKQALEALESYSKSPYIRHQHPKRFASGAGAISALRAAIEQIHTSVDSNTHQCKQEPIAWAVELPDGTRKPLYTHPARQPLTDEQIDAIFGSVIEHYKGHNRWIQITRAIESAHGIGKKA